MRFLTFAVSITASCFLFGLPSMASANSVRVAVAANFTSAAQDIAAAFARETEHEASLSFGATGQFYTQITQEAPFEVLLAADDERPDRAVREGYGVEGSVFSYAIGRLVLYSTKTVTTLGPDTLKAADFARVAIANPETAPYGSAAVEVMNALGVYESLKPKLVQGQNVGQAYQFVQTGNAEIGFVALGQVSQSDEGLRWVVPQDLYQPIRQDAVLLVKGKDNPAAVAFLEFLKGDTAGEIIQRHGYALDR